MLVYSSLEMVFSGSWFTEAPQTQDKTDNSRLNVVFVYEANNAKLVFHGKTFLVLQKTPSLLSLC